MYCTKGTAKNTRSGNSSSNHSASNPIGQLEQAGPITLIGSTSLGTGGGGGAASEDEMKLHRSGGYVDPPTSWAGGLTLLRLIRS